MNSPYGKEQSNFIYFNVGNGQIVQSYPKPEGWDGECDFATGTFTKFCYYWDEGNPSANVAAGYRLDIHLIGQDDGGAVNMVLRAKSPNTFTRMFASYLPHLKVGDVLKVRTWAGTDNSKVTVCSVERLDTDSGAWQKVARVDLPPGKPASGPGGKPDTTAKDAKVHEIYEGHPARKEKQERAQQPVDNGVTELKDEPEMDPFAGEG